MSEEKKLLPGDKVSHTINGVELVIEPMPLGRLKKAIAVVLEIVEELSGAGNAPATDFVKTLPDIITRSLSRLLPLIFDPKVYPMLDINWVEENMSLPTARLMMEQALLVNGLEGFFGQQKPNLAAPAPSQPPKVTPAPVSAPTSPGSTTSSESPTAGPSDKPTS